MKRIFTSLILLLGFLTKGQAQLLVNQCESQTPCNARPICGTGNITSVYSFSTTAPYNTNPIPTCASSAGTYTSNWVYYRFTCYSTGTLNFRLNSNDSAGVASDYDWAVWDITSSGCGSLTTANTVACNAAGNGATGILTGGTPAANFANNITITAGSTYILGVSNATGANTGGFTINFTGTTASLTDNKKPYMVSVLPQANPCVPISSIKIKLSEPVRCSQLGVGSDFTFSPSTPSFTVTPGASCPGCTNAAPNVLPNFGQTSDTATVTFASNLTPGTYTVAIALSNSFLDLCANQDSTSVTLTFNVPAPFHDSVRSGFDCVNLKYIDTVYGVNGTSPYQYKAVGGGLPVSAGVYGASTPSYTIYSVSGGTTVTYSVKDALGCTMDTVFNRPSVLALGAPNLSVSSSPPCHDQFSLDSISVISQSGGIGPYTFSLSPTFAGIIYVPSVANPTKWKNIQFPGLGQIFTVTVTDALGCTRTGLKNLVNPSVVTVTASTTNPICFGDSSGKITMTPSGGTPGSAPNTYTFTINPINGSTYTNTPTFNYSHLPIGTYTITAIDANGCTGSVVKTLSQPAAISINTTAATIVNPTCPANCNGTYQPIATGGTGNKKFYKYPYNPVSGTYADSVITSVAPANKFYNLCAGTYTILAKDAQGCTATTTLTLALPPKPSLSLTTLSPVPCFGGTGSIAVTVGNATPTYTGANYTFLPSPVAGMTTSASGAGGINGTYNNVPAGTYTLIITNANLCADTLFNVVMTQPSAPVTYTSVVVDSVLCFGSSTGAIHVQATGGTNGANTYQYAIAQGAGPFSAYSAATLSSYVFSSLAAGNYTIRVRDNNNCTKDTSVTIYQPTKLHLTLDSLIATCFGTSQGKICVLDTGGKPYYKYKLGVAGTYTSFMPAGTHQCYTGLAAGIYSIFTVDSKGCLDTLTETVAPITLPSVGFTALPNDTVCNGTAITLSGTGTDVYTWTGSPAISNGVAFTPGLGVTSYTVIGTSTTTGCSDSAFVHVQVDPIPSMPTPGNQTVCNGFPTTAVNFSSSVGGSTYTWSQNAGAGIGLPASGNGNIPAFVGVNIGNTPIVATFTVTPTGPASTNCVGADIHFTITINPTPVLTNPSDIEICAGIPTGAINFVSSVSPTTFNWTNSNTTIGLALASGTGNIASFIGSNSGTSPNIALFNVTPVANGCTGLDQNFIVQVDPIPHVDPVTSQSNCNGTQTLPVILTSPVFGTSFSWSNPDPSIGLATSGTGNIPSFTAVNTGNTTKVVTITVIPTGLAPTNCVGPLVSFTYTIYPTPVVTPTADQLKCAGTSTTAISFTSNVPAASGVTTFNWTNDNPIIGLALSGSGNIPSFVTQNPTFVSQSGHIIVTPVTNGCAGTPDTFVITVEPIPVLTAISDQTVCDNESTLPVTYISTVANTVFNWSYSSPINIGLITPGSGNIPSFTAFNGGSTTVVATFTVTPTGPAGGFCVGTPINFSITVLPRQNPNFSYSPSTICITGSQVPPTYAAGANTGGTFSYTGGGYLALNQVTGVIDPATSNAGSYTVKYVTPGPCPDSATYNVTITSAPSATFSYDMMSYCQDAFTIDPIPSFVPPASAGVFSGSPTGIVVDPASGEVNLLASTPGTYTVYNYIAPAGGCALAIDSVQITIDTAIVMNLIPDIVVCNNDIVPGISFSSTVTGTTYQWVCNNPGICLGLPAGNGTGDVPGFVAHNTTSSPQLADFTVFPQGPAPDFCQGDPIDVIVKINPDAQLTRTSPNGTDAQVVCIGQTIQHIEYLATGGVTNADVTGLPQNLSYVFDPGSGILTISGSPAGPPATPPNVYTYTVHATGDCGPDSMIGTINVLPNAIITLTSPPGTDNQTVCINSAIQPISYTIGGTGNIAMVAGLPAGVTGTYVAGNFIINGSPSVSGNYTYTVTANGICASVTSTGVIHVTPLQNPSFGYSNVTYCQTFTPSNQAPVITGISGGVFSSSPLGLTINSSTGVINLATSNPGTYSVTYTTPGPCPNSLIKTIEITAPPTADFNYATTGFCQNGPDPLPTMNAGATMGTFSSSSGLTISAGTGKITTGSSTPGTYTVTNSVPSISGCAAVSSSTTVIIDPIPAITQQVDLTYCNGDITTTIAFNPTVSGTTFSWSVSDPSIGIGGGTGDIPSFVANNPTDQPVTAVITVTPTGPGPDFCVGADMVFNFTVNPDAFINLASASGTDNQIVCLNQSITDINYSVTGGGSGANVNGLPPGLTTSYAGGIFTIQGATSGPAGVYNYIVNTAGTCAQASITGTITVQPDASLTLTSPATQAHCVNSPIDVITYVVGGTGNAATVAGLPAGVTYTGTNPLTISGTATVSGTFTYTVTATGTCGSSTATGTITVLPMQNASFSYGSSTYCQTGTNPLPIYGAGATLGGTFTASPAGMFIAPASGLINLGLSNLGTYTVTYTTPGPAGLCPSSANFTVTITTAPTAGFSYTPSTLCKDGLPVSPTFNPGASGGAFTATPAGLSITGLGVIDPLNSTAGTYTVTNTIAAAGGCAAASATSNVTVMDSVGITNLSNQGPYCAGTLTLPVSFTSNIPGTTFAWSASSSTVGLTPSSGTGSIPSFTTVNNGSTPIVVTFTVTPTSPAPVSCVGSPHTFTMTINPHPIITITSGNANQSVCINTPISSIISTWSGSTSSTAIAGLPAGLIFNNASPSTISGSPTASGSYTYTVTATGCASQTASVTGTITVNPDATVALSSAANTANQTVCMNHAIQTITYTVGATGTGATVTGLPPNVNYSGSTNITISGTPNVSGVYVYTVTATGSCGPATSTGTITVYPLENPAFTYPNVTNCKFGTTAASITGLAGGTFSATPAGIVWLSTATGNIDLANSAVGTYTIKYVTPGTTPGGCKDSTTFSITITTAPNAAFHYASALYCQSAPNPSPIYNGPPNPSSPGVYSNSPVGLAFAPLPVGTINLAASLPGTYWVYNTIAASGVCPMVKDSFQVTVTAAPSIAVNTTTDAGCNPSCNGTATCTLSGGNGVYSCSIAPGGSVTNAGFASGLCAGTTYTITVTDGSGCSGTTVVMVGTTPSPLLTVTSQTTTTTLVNCDATATTAVSSGTPGYTYTISGPGSPLISAAGFASSLCGDTTCISYTIIVTDSKGCKDTVYPCIQAPGLLTCVPTHTNVSCFGGTNGTLTDSVYGGTPPYTFVSLTGPSGVVPYFPGLPVNIINATGLAAGNYTATWKDANNISCSSIITVTQPIQLVFTAPVIVTPSCSPGCDGSLTITANGGTGTKTYTIAYPAGNVCTPVQGAAGTFTNLGTGSYTVTVTDANNCTASTTVQVNASPNPTLALSHVNPLCHNDCNGSITAIGGAGTPGFTYAITSPAGTVCIPTQSSPASGNFSTLGSGIYTIVVTDTKSCTASGTQTLSNPATLNLNTPQVTEPSCNGSCNGKITLTALGGTPPLNYSCFPPLVTNATGIFTTLCANSYTVTVKDANNCSVTSTATVVDPAQLVWNTTSHTDITCNGAANGVINVTALGGTGTKDYSKNGTTFFPSGNFTGLLAGTYTITAKDANGCTITTLFTVIEPPVLNITIQNVQQVSCNGASDGSIKVIATGGTPGYSYHLTPSIAANNLNGNFINLPAGNYTVTVTDTNGCTKSTPVITITQPAPLIYTLTNHQDVACFGDATGSITVSTQGGTPAVIYSILPNTGSQAPAGYFSGLTAGTYTVKATDQNNCLTTTVVTITQGAQILFLNVTMNQPICHGDANGSISLTAMGGTGLLRYRINGGPLQPDTVFNNLTAGPYGLTIVDALGCSKDTALLLTEPDPVGALINLRDANCTDSEDGKAIIVGTGGRGGFKYYITPGLHINKSGIFTNLGSGTYQLRVDDTAGCEYRTQITINPPANPLVNVITKQDLGCNGVGNEGSALANVTGGTPPYTYLWSTDPAQTTQKASTLYFGYYDVTVTDANGCEIKDTVYIEEGPCCDVAFIPNAFSPNGDGVNDEFRVLTTAGVELIQLEIYNRWGKRVWSTIDYRHGWDGKIDGQDAAIDTYYYILRYKCTRDNITYTKKRDVLLIR